MHLNPIPPPLPHLPFISTKEEFKDVTLKEGFIRKRKLSDYHSESSTNTRKESLNESFNGLNLNNNSGCSSLGNESNISIPKPIRPNKISIPINPITFNNEQGKVIERLFDFKLNDINAFEKYRKIQQEGSSPQKMVEEPLPNSNSNNKNMTPPTALNNNLIPPIQQSQPALNIPMCYFPFGMPIGKTSFTDLLQKNFEDLKQLQNTNIQFLGPLTLEERAAKVNKYLEKKKNRKWKYVRYSVRKDLADQRQRVQGRFVKTNKKLFLPMNASFEENLGSFSDMGNSGGSV
jgi:hypothetical protein